MNYTQLAPSRELCEELARLGICQDEPELYWTTIDTRVSYSVSDHKWGHNIIAPTLPMLMSELPCGYSSGRGFPPCSAEETNIIWESNGEAFCWDKHLPDAIARALIAIKKGNV